MPSKHLKGYVPDAIKNNLYDCGWQGVPEILKNDWKPYLDGKIDLTMAIRRLIVDYGVDPPAEPGRRILYGKYILKRLLEPQRIRRIHRRGVISGNQSGAHRRRG